MERLEPLLKQKFWILLGVGMIMTIVGWWVSTSSMASTIGVRTKEINEAVTKVPGGEIPNVSWASKLSAINARQDLSINVTQLDLWKRQHSKMRLPDGVDAQAQYQAKLSNESRELFRDGYPHEVRRVWKAVSPMDVDGTGIVQYPLLAFGKALGKGPWPNQPPPNQDIWDVMEDLWLAESLFQSIAAVNGGHEAGRTDACIHQIDRFEFRGGGEKQAQGAAASGGGGGADNMGGMGMAMGMASRPGAGSGGGGGGGAGAGLATVSAEFDPREEFGDDGSSSASGSGAGAIGMGMMMGSMGSGSEGSSVASAAKTVNRYVVSDEALPYKTRGFYLSVKMDHRKIPQLIAELTANEKSVWPVEIRRVQMSRLNEDDSATGSGFMPGMAGMPGMGSMGAAMSSPSYSSSGAGMGPGSLGASNGEEDLTSLFNPSVGHSLPVGSAAQLAQSRLMFENALRDPSMAQVTLCGVFTLYKFDKSKEPVSEKPAASPANSDLTTNPDPSIEDPSAEPVVPSAKAAIAESETETDGQSAEAANPAIEADDKPTVEAMPTKESETSSVPDN